MYFVVKLMFIEYEIQIQNSNMIQKIRVIATHINVYIILYLGCLDAQWKIWILKQRLMADWCQYS